MKPPNTHEYRIRFAFTPGERRAIVVLAVIFILGLISLQYRRWRMVDEKEVTIVGAKAVDTAMVHGVKPSLRSVARIAPSTGEKKDFQTDPIYPEEKQNQYQETVGQGGVLTVDLNRASATELEKLPGIGPVLAQRIIEFRDNHGKFERVEDLLLVRGIGQKRLADLLPYIVVSP